MRLVFKATSICLLFLSGIHAFSPSGGTYSYSYNSSSRGTKRITTSTCPAFQNTHDTSSFSFSSSSLKVASEPATSLSNTENENENETSASFLQPSPNLIPPPSSKQPKLEAEFFSMMLDFAEFTPKDIASISDPRYRALYEGVTAGANEPLVMNAFSVIFQDLMPIRVAGRMIYRHLKSTMEECIEERDCREEKLVNDHGLDMHTINHGRRAFMAIMQEQEHGAGAEGCMTLGALIDTGIVDTVVELLEFDSFDEFVSMMDADADEKISFEKFMVGLQNCKGNAEESCDITCDLSQVLNEIIKRMEPIEAARNEVDTDVRKKKFSDKYDFMVKTFEEWEELVPSGEGRMLEVLKGSFAGAKNAKIVKALKIVYMDYSALRLGGDLVFKLMGQLMKRRQKKQAS